MSIWREMCVCSSNLRVVLLFSLAVAAPLVADGKIPPTYEFGAWSSPIQAGTCSSDAKPQQIKIPPKEAGTADGIITCALENAVKSYHFPPGIFEIGVQFLLPPNMAITGANSPNDKHDPTKTPDWAQQTLFLATRGATDYNMNYCHASDMVNTRVGFVLSSRTAVKRLSYQGIDTIRPNDNGALCGGGAFETKGCAENDCHTGVNNGGSDGEGSVGVVIEDVRLNDYYHEADKAKIGANVAGNYACKSKSGGCCFCKPNGVRASQVGIWVPLTRNAAGTRDLMVTNVVSRATQADGINLHGNVTGAIIADTYFESSGDDLYAVWGAQSAPRNITFRGCVGVNPGVLRPNWYGNCVATYGLQSVTFRDITCRAPALEHPLPNFGPGPDGATRIDNSMFVFYTSFGGDYPPGNSIVIDGWTFEDLAGHAYEAGAGVMNRSIIGKMAWAAADNGVIAPFWFPTKGKQAVHVTAHEHG